MNGISFMVRVHNEEQTIEKSIKSLDGLKIPHEIVVLLHRCTDSSEDIVKKLQQEGRLILIHHYDNPVSRAGYETICTNVNSVHSLPYYLNWCLSKCSMKWKFKWDADFIMTSQLAEFLNYNLDQFSNTAFRINAINSTSSNGELYLTDSLIGYSKYIFWEVPNFSPSQEVRLGVDQNIIHASEIANIKQYWKMDPWFYKCETMESDQIKRKYEMLVSEFGKEPSGFARASNPECDKILLTITNSNPEYVSFFK